MNNNVFLDRGMHSTEYAILVYHRVSTISVIRVDVSRDIRQECITVM